MPAKVVVFVYQLSTVRKRIPLEKISNVLSISLLGFLRRRLENYVPRSSFCCCCLRLNRRKKRSEKKLSSLNNAHKTNWIFIRVFSLYYNVFEGGEAFFILSVDGDCKPSVCRDGGNIAGHFLISDKTSNLLFLNDDRGAHRQLSINSETSQTNISQQQYHILLELKEKGGS